MRSGVILGKPFRIMKQFLCLTVIIATSSQQSPISMSSGLELIILNRTLNGRKNRPMTAPAGEHDD